MVYLLCFALSLVSTYMTIISIFVIVVVLLLCFLRTILVLMYFKADQYPNTYIFTKCVLNELIFLESHFFYQLDLLLQAI